MTCPFAREAAFKGGINAERIDDQCRKKSCAAWVVTNGDGCCQRLFPHSNSEIEFENEDDDKKQ